MTRPVCYLGIGHDQSATPEEILALVTHCLRLTGLAAADLAAIASIEEKAHSGLVDALAQRLDLTVMYFNAARLEAETPRLANPSDLVFRTLGCHGVAEAAALAAAGPDAVLALAKTKGKNVTCAIARRGGRGA